MGVGIPIGDIISVPASGSAVIQPSTGETWIISNIYIPDGATTITVYLTDGTNDIKITAPSGSLLGYGFILTNTQYLKITNSGAAAVLVGYDGFKVG